jgi:hypothetical protein
MVEDDALVSILQVVENGIFFHFYDTLGFAMNGIVFFFAGASSVNFFYRYVQCMLSRHSLVSVLIPVCTLQL